jgi:hypothetical protein
MTRKHLLAAAATAFAVVGIGGTVVATTAAASPTPASAGTTIVLTAHAISDRSFNLAPGHGFVVGSVELAASRLMHGGKQIGHDAESYTVTRLSGGSADQMVAAVEVLAHGQIDLSGLVTSTPSGPGTFQLAITGGTGSYSGARGYAIVVPNDAPTITIHLR